jgi:hypothetical protein
MEAGSFWVLLRLLRKLELFCTGCISHKFTSLLLSMPDSPVALSGPFGVLLQLLRKLELFCGGGGLSFMAQEDDKNNIVSAWANDINASACATYVANKPHTFVSIDRGVSHT